MRNKTKNREFTQHNANWCVTINIPEYTEMHLFNVSIDKTVYFCLFLFSVGVRCDVSFYKYVCTHDSRQTCVNVLWQDIRVHKDTHTVRTYYILIQIDIDFCTCWMLLFLTFLFFCFILFIRNWMTESIDCIDNSMVHVIKSDYIIISVRWICTCRRNDGIWFGFILFVAFVSPPSNTPTYIVMYTSTGRRSHNPQSSWDYWRGNRMDGPHQFVYGSQWFACVGVQFHLKPESPSHTHDNTHCIAVDWKQTENKKREKANK